MKKRAHITYRGDVQGIGFRFTAERVATSLDLTGWVRNLDDGRVEVVCEGSEGGIVKFLEKIQDVFGIAVCDRDVEWNGATGEFQGFDIRF